ncbi:hypothetical protein STEG23_017513, partial [Scotinomys teguina]
FNPSSLDGLGFLPGFPTSDLLLNDFLCFNILHTLFFMVRHEWEVWFMINVMNLLNEYIIQFIESETYVSGKGLRNYNSNSTGLIHCDDTSGKNPDKPSAINHDFLPAWL